MWRAQQPSQNTQATKLQPRSSAGKRGCPAECWAPPARRHPEQLVLDARHTLHDSHRAFTCETRVVLDTHAGACTPSGCRQRQLMMATDAIDSLGPHQGLKTLVGRWMPFNRKSAARRPFSSLQQPHHPGEICQPSIAPGNGLGIELCCGNEHQPTQQVPLTTCTRAAPPEERHQPCPHKQARSNKAELKK